MKTFKTSICLLIVLCGAALVNHSVARADDFSTWHFYADVIVQPQADNSFASVYADFGHLLERDFKQKDAALDENSIRVAPLQDGKAGEAVQCRFVKGDGYDATKNAAGTIVFGVSGKKEPTEETYRVFFDTKANGSKLASPVYDDVPLAANMVWNGGFEILSQGYTGPNRYANVGENMPRGWWGNLPNGGILSNNATSAHSGKHALGIVAKEGRNVSVVAAPSPPTIRVTPGQTYQFSGWIKGAGLTSMYPTYAAIMWYDKDQKQIERTNIDSGLGKTGDFDWTQVQASLTAPVGAVSVAFDLGTYSNTGLLTIDDFDIHLVIPPTLVS